MPEYPTSGIKLEVLTGDALEAVSTLEGHLDDITGGTYTALVDVEVDDTAMSDVPTEDTEVTTTNKLEVEQDEKDKAAIDQAEFFFKTKNFETIWNWTVKGLEIFQDVGGKLINPILDLGDAVAEVGAKTGGAIPNADELINKIFYSDIGKSKEEVGKMIIAAHGLGLPIEEAVMAAGKFTHTWSDVDSVQAITTFGTLLNTHLVDNMKEASDLMTVFFQQGGNKGGDALAVVNANAESWSNMGLTASQALSTISSLLKGNVEDASTAAKMMQTLDDSLTTAAADAKSPQAQLLKQMGLENPKDKGEAMGADFIDGFAAAFAKMPPDQQDLISGTFMGKGGKKFTGAIEEMTAKSDMFKNITGAAELAAEEIDNSLRGAIDDFVLEANKKMEEFLSSDVIDIDGKINKLKEGLQKGMDTLAQGGTLSEALTVALKPIGFDDEFQGLESALGNFVIAILQAVESIQRALPGGGEAADRTAFTLHQLEGQQLAFDLKIANPDDVAARIEQAAQRGLDPSVIAGSVSTAVNELIASGAPQAAQDLIDELNKGVGKITFNVPDAIQRSILEGQGLETTFTIPITPEMSPEDVQKLIEDTKTKFSVEGGIKLDATVQPGVDQATINELQNNVTDAMKDVNPVMEEAKKNITDATNPIADMGNEATDAKPSFDALAQGVDKLGGKSKVAAPAVADTAVSIDDVGLSAMVAAVQVNSFGNSIDATTAKLAVLNEAAGNAAINSNPETNTPASGPHAAGGQFVGTGLVGEQGREIVSSNTGLAVLNNMTTENILAALQGFIPGQSIMGRTGNSYTAINNNFVPNEATADALGYKTATTLRGMAGGD